MQRDNKFEVQYLLSLMIVTSGIVGTTELTAFLNNFVGGVLLLVSSVHLGLLSIIYSYRNAGKFTDSSADAWEEKSIFTLTIVTLVFVYTVFHALGVVTTDLLDGYRIPSWKCVRSIIIYWVPFIPMALLGKPIFRRLRSSLAISEDISVSVVPESVRVFDSYEESRPILVEIENTGQKEYEFDIEISLPEHVKAKLDGDVYNDEIRTTTNLGPDERFPGNISLRHDAEKQASGIIRVNISHKTKEFSEEVDCVLKI